MCIRDSAPRERVSWNLKICQSGLMHSVTLHVSVWVEIFKLRFSVFVWMCHAPRERVSWNNQDSRGKRVAYWSRSTWACELKCLHTAYVLPFERHAPRERVSWNVKLTGYSEVPYVTLHVSVWVEIVCDNAVVDNGRVTLHVSVWVEIKCVGTYKRCR